MSRSNFNESWLTEMPKGIGKIGMDFFSTIYNSLREFISYGGQPSELPNGYKKMFGQQVAYYWHETNDVVNIVAELTVTPQSLIVNGVASNTARNTVIYASDLYSVILADNHKSIRLMSDTSLSDSGYALWKRLLSLGHTISVYDKNTPGSSLISIQSAEDMDKFFKLHSPEHKHWQYVLSETGIKLAETRSYFNTRRMRELAGIDTDE